MYEQWRAMQSTLGQATSQTAIAGDSLRINAQAYVCVRDIQLDLVKDRIFIEVENLGRVPASSIEVEVWLEIRGLFELGIKSPAPFHNIYKYGEKTELFSGNLPINIRIPHDQWLKPDDIRHIKSGAGSLIAEGLITFYDGFLPREPKRTHFAFKYRLSDKKWFPQRIVSPGELEESKAEIDEGSKSRNEKGENGKPI